MPGSANLIRDPRQTSSSCRPVDPRTVCRPLPSAGARSGEASTNRRRRNGLAPMCVAHEGRSTVLDLCCRVCTENCEREPAGREEQRIAPIAAIAKDDRVAACGYCCRDKRRSHHLRVLWVTIDAHCPARVKGGAQHDHAGLAHFDGRAYLALVEKVGLGDHCAGGGSHGLRRQRARGIAVAERDPQVVTCLSKPGTQEGDASHGYVRPVRREAADDPTDPDVADGAHRPQGVLAGSQQELAGTGGAYADGRIR